MILVIMGGTIVANSVLPNILFQLLSLHECKVAIHVQNGTETKAKDDALISRIGSELQMSLLVQEADMDLSYETCMIGKACIVSFSEEALAGLHFEYRCKRPVKILLGSSYSRGYPEVDYQPIVFEFAPVVSLTETAFNSGMNVLCGKIPIKVMYVTLDTIIISTMCPGLEKSIEYDMFNKYENESLDTGLLPTCVPNLNVSNVKYLSIQ